MQCRESKPFNANCTASETTLFLAECLLEERAGDGGGVPGEGFGGALGDDPATSATTVRAEVEKVIDTFQDIQIVLDDDYRVALIDKLLQNVEQHFDVLEMEAGSRLVQDVQGVAGGLAE